VVPKEKISEEAGEDIVRFRNGHGKIELLLDYLYKQKNNSGGEHVLSSLFLAPSIIVRSELELLGISSPRFALRYLIPHGGFLTIRRRNVAKRRIREAFEGRDEICRLLSIPIKDGKSGEDVSAEDSANWIAESMLPIPERFRQKTNHFICCSKLIEEFGLRSSDPLVPFVTHVSFGGGLCSQAACFMVLCFLEHEKIIGISEITQQASGWIPPTTQEKRKDLADHLLCVRGMVPNQMESFFKNLKSPDLDAQLQHYSLDHDGSDLLIAKAIRTYIRNQVPVIQIVSLERMVGDPSGAGGKAVVVPVDAVDHNDYSHIPIGAFDRKATEASGGIAHSVVIFGCNEKGFFLNDPATFPFLYCTDQQLIEIGKVDSGAIEDSIPRTGYTKQDYQVGEWLGDGPSEKATSVSMEAVNNEPYVLPFISVTRYAIDLPLLRCGIPKIRPGGRVDSYAPRTGLFSMVAAELASGDCFGWEIARSLDNGHPYPIHGEYYLVIIRSSNDGDLVLESHHPDWKNLEFDQVLSNQKGNTPDWACSGRSFWLHRVDVSRRNHDGIADDTSYDGVFLWDARSRSTNTAECLKGVWIRNSSGWVSQPRLVKN